MLTVEEAAAVLRVGRNTVYEAIRSGEVPSLRIKRRILVPKSALLHLLGGHGRGSESPSPR
ncbi:MAG TPA: helix-turn-helix domain-containing protein [Chthonomonadaceae bacterium]|nr:helix-turn-helix domain-containing protein [Chthonomonadaceae bacterium]